MHKCMHIQAQLYKDIILIFNYKIGYGPLGHIILQIKIFTYRLVSGGNAWMLLFYIASIMLSSCGIP